MKLQDSIVAARYARAFLQAAQAAKAQDKAREELRRCSQLLRTNTALANLLNHPLLPMAEKRHQAAKVMGQALSPIFERLLDVVLKKKRLRLLPYIASKFDDMLDAVNKVVKVHVKSAKPL